MTGGKVRQYPYFVRLAQTHTSEKCRTKKRMTRGSWPGEKGDIILTLSDYSTHLRSVELGMRKGSRVISHFHTSEKCRTKEEKGI